MKKFLSSYWLRSAFYSFLQRFSLLFFGLGSFLLLIRFLLSKEQMSTWALFLLIITILENTKSALLKTAHIKFVSTNTLGTEKASIASSSLLVNGSITFIFILSILLFGKTVAEFFNTGTELYAIFLWFMPGLVGLVFFSHFEAIQQSHFDFKGVFAANLIRQILFFSSLAFHAISKTPIEIELLGIYQSISVFAGVVVLFLMSKNYLLMKFNPTWNWIKKITKFGGYIFGTGVVSNIFSNLDQFMTASILLPGSVAYYNAAKRINGFIDVPTYAAAEILVPKMAVASSVEGKEKVKYLYEKMVSILLLFIVPAALIIIIFPKIIIYIIAGPKYFAAAPILQVSMFVSTVGIIQHQAATTLFSMGKAKTCFYVSLVSLCINIGITYLCLKTIGFYGAAVSSFIIAFITGTVWYWIMRKEVGFELIKIPLYCKEYLIKAYNWSRNYLQKSSIIQPK